jgi:hypothetical protein
MAENSGMGPQTGGQTPERFDSRCATRVVMTCRRVSFDFRNFARGLDVRIVSYDGVVLRYGFDRQDSALAGLLHDLGPGCGWQ